MSFFGSTDFITEVNKGNIPGHSMIGIVASSDDVGLTYSDIWQSSGDLVYPTAGETLEIACSDANDTAAGSGATEVTVVSIDADGKQQVTVAETNGGTTNISNTHHQVQSINVTGVGTVRGANIGTIELRVSGGGNTRATITPGRMNDYNSHYTVPAGFTSLWMQAVVNSVKGEDTKIRPLVQTSGVGPFHIGGESSTYQNSMIYPFKTFASLPEGTNILWQAKSTNSDVFVTAVLELMLIDNDLIGSQGGSSVSWLP